MFQSLKPLPPDPILGLTAQLQNIGLLNEDPFLSMTQNDEIRDRIILSITNTTPFINRGSSL